MMKLIRAVAGVVFAMAAFSSWSQSWVNVTGGIPLGGQTTTGTGGTSSNFFSVTGLGPASGSGRLFVGLGPGGVYYSDNQGANWTAANSGLLDTFSGAAIPARSFYRDGSTVVRGGESASFNNHAGSAVFRSTDSGVTWTEQSVPETAQFVKFASGGGRIYAASTLSGAHYSSDGGVSWTRWSTGMELPFSLWPVARAIAYNNGKVFAGSALLGVMASTDGGATWTFSDNGINLVPQLIYRTSVVPLDLVATPSGVLYVLINGESNAETYSVYRSTDNGANWSKISFPGAFPATGGNSLWRMVNNGEDIIVASTYIVSTANVRAWIYRPANGWYALPTAGFVPDASGGEAQTAVNGGQLFHSNGTNLFRLDLATAPLTPLAPANLTIRGGGGVNIGTTATLSASVNGTLPLSYQWYREGVLLGGQTAAEYQFTPASVLDGGTFQVVVSNASGSVTNSVVVTVAGTQAGARDFTFRSGLGTLGTFGFSYSAGVVLSVSGGGTDAILPLPDGKLLVGGGFSGVGNPTVAFGTPVESVTPDMVTPVNNFIRLNADGSLDTSFKPGAGPNGKVRAMARQPDGRVLIGGEFTSYNGLSVGRIARLNADGSIDPSFQTGAGASSYIRSIIVLPDGKLLVAGAFTSWDERGLAGVVRLNSDGTLDTGFKPDFAFNGEVTSLQVQPDGQILVGGAFTQISANSQTYANLIRLNPNGTLDTTFRTTTGVGTVMAIQLLADGRVAAAGLNNPYLRVYSSVGVLDNTFSVSPGGQLYALGLLPGGEIVAAGDGRQILYGPTGTVITNLAARPLGVSPTYWSVATLPDGRFFVGDYAGSGGGGVAKFYGSTVTQAISANPSPVQTTAGNAVSFSVGVRGAGPFTYQWKKDGTNLIGATTATYSILSANATHVGNYSVEVTGPGGVMNSTPAGLTLLGTPIILDPPRSQFVALNVPVTLGVRALGAGLVTYQWKKGTGAISGATNATFTIAAISPADADSYTVDVTALGVTVPSAAAVLTTGRLPGAVDRSFVPFYTASGATAGDVVSDAVAQPDGKIVVASGRTSFNGRTGVRGVFRLNLDGSFDTSFAPTNTMESTAVALQSDGKILLGFARNATVAQLYRLTSDGKVDPTFANPLLSMNGRVSAIVPLSDGKVLISGTFTSAGGIGRTNLARFHSDGSLDTNYAPVIPASSSVLPLADGRVVVGYRLSNVDYTPILDVNGQIERYLGSGPFGGAVGFNNPNQQVRLLPDGGFLTVNSSSVLRYLSDGSPDPTWKFFFSPGGSGSAIKQALVQPDGRVLLFGEFPGNLLTSTNPATRALSRTLVRLTPDGQLDGTFDQFGGGLLTGFAGGAQPERALLLPDGRVFVAGYFNSWNGLPSEKIQVIQGDLIEPAFFNQVTSLVLTQGHNLVLTPSPRSIAAATYQWRKGGFDLVGETGPSLSIAAIGVNGSGDYTLVASSPLGTNSTTTSVTVLGAPIITHQPVTPPAVVANPFTMSVVVTGAPPFSFQWRKAGSPIGGATFRTFTNLSAALGDSGNYDVVIQNSFGSVTSSVAVVTVITQPGQLVLDYSNNVGQAFHFVRQRDGKVLVGRSAGPARLNLDGTPDTNFNSKIAALVGGQAMALGEDGMVYHTANAVLHRYFPDGTRDTNFALVNNVNAITALAIQPDGRIVAGYSAAGMRRYFADGTQDFAFTNNVTQVRSLALLPDGEILVATGNGFSSGSVRKLNSDGSLDAAFDNASTFNNDVLSVVPLANGKILVGGTFTTHSVFGARQYVARLNASGSVDGTFTGPTFSSVLYGVQDVAVQENGRIVVVGGFGTVNGLGRLGVARLEENGAHDATFDIGTGAGVSNIKLQTTTVLPDGRILVGGIFTTFNGVSRNGLALLNGDVVNLGFLTEPADQTLNVGQTLNLSASTTATTPVGYQWFFNNTAINGATGSGYSIGTTTTNNRGNYFVVASNLSGFRTSAVSKVKILAAPEFLAQPVATNGYLNKPVTFAGRAEGLAPLGYSWLKDSSIVPSATNATLALSNLQFSAAGFYALVVSNSLGSITSAPVYLPVTILPGSVDLAFNASNYLNSASALAALPDGRLYVGGGWVSNAVTYSRGVTRLLPDGRLDTTFAQTNTSLSAASIIRIDPQGRLLCVVGNLIYRILPSGLLDPTWTGINLGFNFGIGGVAIQKDGKILVGGSSNILPSNLVRLEPDGAIDTTFKLVTSDRISSVLLLSDESILAGTGFNPSIRLKRFLPDGAVYPGFTNVVFNANSLDMTRLFELSDGRILVGGAYPGKLLRFLPNGALDPSFVTPVLDTGSVSEFVVEPGGKIVVAGSFNTWNNVPAPGLVRLSADGVVDTNFFNSGASPAGYTGLARQFDGRLILSGTFTTFDSAARTRVAGAYGTPVSLAITNLPLAQSANLGASVTLTAGGWSATGAPLSYQWRKNGQNLSGANGPTLTLNPLQRSDAAAYSVVVGDGSSSVTSAPAELVVLAEPFFVVEPTSLVSTQAATATFRAQVRGLQSIGYQWFRNGTPVPGATNSLLTLTGLTVADAGSYSLVASNSIGQTTSDPAFLTVNLLPAGSVDPGFHTNVVGGNVLSFDVDPSSGRIMVGGQFTTWSNVTRTRFAFLGASDGALLTNTMPSVNSTIQSVAVMPDGRTLIGGFFGGISDTIAFNTRNGLGRIQASGLVDTTFTNLIAAVSPSSPSVYSITPLSDGSALVGGYFYTVGATRRTNFAKLTPGGFVDPNFGSSSNMTDNTVYDAAVQSDNRIVIVGNFTNVLGQSRGRVARLTADGSLDASFTNEIGANTAFSTVFATAVQSDGKILIGGSFTTVNGVSRAYLARLQPDGALDTGFIPTLNAQVRTLALQADGKILLGGSFMTVNGQSYQRIVRLNSNGTTDTSFNVNGGAGSEVTKIRVQADGSILASGAFTSFGGQTKYYLARLFGDGQLAPVISAQPAPVSATQGESFSVSVGAAGVGPLRFQWRRDGTNLVGQTNSALPFTSASTNSSGNYSVVVTNVYGAITSSVVAVSVQAGGGASPFDSWATGAGLTGGNNAPGDDADGDGIPNVFEFYFGSQPLSAASGVEPFSTSVTVSAQSYPAISFIRSKTASGVTPEIRVSSTVDFADSLGSTSHSVIDLGNGTELVVIRSNVSTATQPNQFMELRLSIP